LESIEWARSFPLLGYGSWALKVFGNAYETIESASWVAFLRGGGGGNDKEIFGHPPTRGEGGCTISFQPSLTGT
jgi:hypothetical protein